MKSQILVLPVLVVLFPIFALVEPGHGQTTVAAYVESSFGSLEFDSSTRDPAALSGSLSSSVNHSGNYENGDPFFARVNTTLTWGLAGNGSQGFVMVKSKGDRLNPPNGYLGYEGTILHGFVPEISGTFHREYNFMLDYESEFLEDFYYNYSDSFAVTAGSPVGLEWGGGGNHANDSTIYHAQRFGIGGLPGEKATPWMPTGPQEYKSQEEINTIVGDHIDENIDDDEEPIERSEWVAGIDLTTPFQAPAQFNEDGESELVYFDPELAIGFGFTNNNENRFKSFEIPEALPQGDSEFAIVYQNKAYLLNAGVEFDFTEIDENGFDSFLLLNIDESELIDVEGNSHPPFTFGLSFMNNGMADFSTFALIYVPEPSASMFALVFMFGIAMRRPIKRA